MQAAASNSTSTTPIWSHPRFAANFYARREAPEGMVVSFYEERMRLGLSLHGRFQIRAASLTYDMLAGREGDSAAAARL